MEDKIQLVKDLATKLHGDQKRKYTGDDYVTHTFRVADIVKEHGGDDNMVMAAILHDVLEDTPTTEDQLLDFMMEIVGPSEAIDVVKMVKELTDIFTKENYPDLNRKGRKEMEAIRLGRVSPRAQTIKYADLLDNGEDIMKNDPKFGKVYLREKETILKYMNKGNKTLYKKCVDQLTKNN